MADATGPNLLVVGGDSKRLQWLTHHVTSHWPDAQVTTVPAEESASFSRLIAERAPDAVILQADFAEEAAADMVLALMTQLLQAQPALYCILLAKNGSELSAVRTLKSGAKDYLPLARITRDQLLAAVTPRGTRGQALESLRCGQRGHRSPRLLHRQANRHQQFLAGFPGAQRAAAAQCRAQGHESRRFSARTR
jgi:DNA-binding NtrC family response regulator